MQSTWCLSDTHENIPLLHGTLRAGDLSKWQALTYLHFKTSPCLAKNIFKSPPKTLPLVIFANCRVTDGERGGVCKEHIFELFI